MATPISYFTRQYYQHHRSLRRREKTLQWHETSHRLFFKLCNIKSVEDITRESVRNFVYINSQQGKSPETIRTYMRSIKAFYNWLLEEEYTTEDIFKKKILLPDLEEKAPKLISRDDLRKISKMLDVYPYYQNMQERLRTKCLFSLYMNTGLRKMEALEIKMDYVKMAERTIFIEKTKTKDCRNVVINDDLYEVLEEYLDSLKSMKFRNEYLFFINDENFSMSESSLKRIKEKIEAFGIRRFKIKKFTVHMFRHTYISYSIADGLPLPFIMNQVGHRKITTTQGYTHKPQKEMMHALSNYSILGYRG